LYQIVAELKLKKYFSTMEQLNHHNPEYVTWKYEELHFTLLGGIRIEGLHSMRVTLKVDCKTFPAIRHGLDLYNESQTQKLVKSIAERFTLTTTYVHTAVGHLINTVEDYRLSAMDNEKLKMKNVKPLLSKEEITEAETFLKESSPFGAGLLCSKKSYNITG
jgi:predicted DNA-binding protein